MEYIYQHTKSRKYVLIFILIKFNIREIKRKKIVWDAEIKKIGVYREANEIALLKHQTLRHWRELHLRQATNQLNISLFGATPCCEGNPKPKSQFSMFINVYSLIIRSFC